MKSSRSVTQDRDWKALLGECGCWSDLNSGTLGMNPRSRVNGAVQAGYVHEKNEDVKAVSERAFLMRGMGK